MLPSYVLEFQFNNFSFLQAFSELEKLRPHVLKHSNVSPSKIPDSEEHSTDDEGSSAIQTPEDNPSRSSPHLSSSNKLRSSPSSTESAAPNHPFPKFDPFPSSPLSNFLSYPGAHSPYLFLQQNPLTSLYAGMMFGGSGGSVTAGTGGTSSSSPSFPIPIPHPQSGGSVSLRGASSPPAGLLSTTPEASSSPLTPQNMKRPPSASPSSPASPSEAKKARMQMRILKDEPVPEGYIRFRFNEDCAYVHCGYREHQTHFHCTREDCGYSFCDKTRFVQHTARHERLDTLMGGDFKQFRANVSCGRPDCAYKTAQGTNQLFTLCFILDWLMIDTVNWLNLSWWNYRSNSSSKQGKSLSLFQMRLRVHRHEQSRCSSKAASEIGFNYGCRIWKIHSFTELSGRHFKGNKNDKRFLGGHMIVRGTK